MLEIQAVKEEQTEPHVAIQIREADIRMSSMAAVHEEPPTQTPSEQLTSSPILNVRP